MISSPVHNRGIVLALLVSAWVVALGCFPVFTPEVNRRSAELTGSINDEVARNQARLYIIGTEERHGLRRYRLALVGLLKDRDQPSVTEFVHDEATGAVNIVRESRVALPLPAEAKGVRLFQEHDLRRKKELPNRAQQIASILTNDGDRPTAVFMEGTIFGEEHVELQFHYRDQQDIIRRANLVVIPRSLNQHPGLSALNRLNYLWSVPADTVVVVVGWAIFWPFGLTVSSGGLNFR